VICLKISLCNLFVSVPLWFAPVLSAPQRHRDTEVARRNPKIGYYLRIRRVARRDHEKYAYNKRARIHLKEPELSTSTQAVANEQTRKYLTLLELSKAIASHRELPLLFHDLACRLKTLFDFTHLGILLHDPAREVMKMHLIESCEPSLWSTPKEVPIAGSIAGWVWETQQPVVIRDLELEERFPAAKALPDRPVRSVCSLPLTTGQTKLGILTFWSEKPAAYDQLDLEFAQLVAAQVAIAVEAQCHQQRLARERDRSQLLLEVNNTLVSHLNLRELLSAISRTLNVVMPHDAAALALYDEPSNALRLTALEFPDHEEPCAAGEMIPLEGPAGQAFTTRKPVVSDYSKTGTARLRSSGLKSGCTAPLVFRDRALGILSLKSLKENAFSQDDAELLGQVASQVAIAVENALAYREIENLKNKLEGEKLYLEEEIRTEYNFEEIVGNSPALKRVLQDVETVAQTDSTVLIYGETGTGKELIAHAIHNLSQRRERTLVKVNCAAIPTGLLESEFFGHERGAFTGAIDRRIGRFELANEGTIFLDEVEDIPLELQSKLLRVLQEHEFERLGSSRTLQVSVRVVAATNTELTELVADKKFRSDLYYRLNVFPITVPPLRERREDIPMLVHFFAAKFAQQMKKKIESVPKETMAALTSYHWPGNIRELQNLVERGVILSRGASLDIPLGELRQSSKTANHSTGATTLEAVEREHILRMLSESNWVIGGPLGAAARLGVNRTTLNHRIRKLGITRPQPQSL
jgi:formate hydrogenlyase transcriptional activator